MKRTHVVPALVLVAGLIAGTLLSLTTETNGWLVMSGPLVLGLAVIGSNVLQRRLEGIESGVAPQTLTLAAAVVFAGALVAWTNPENVAMMLPILGGGVAIPFATRPCGTSSTCTPPL